MSENKNLDPSDRKIEKAREQGQIAQSRDLSALAKLIAVAELAFVAESQWRESLHSLMDISYASVGKPFLPALHEAATSVSIFLLIVFFIGLVLSSLVSIASHWGQFGILVTPEALMPKLDKLNPVNGFKSIFSLKKLVEMVETIIKTALIGWIVYILTYTELDAIIKLSGGTPKDIYTAFIELLRNVFHIVVVLCLIMAFLDFAIQKYFHKKELMMDEEEQKQEYKEMEGNPMVKGKRKEIAREWANADPVAQTEGANAVVVNPTHFAIAMFYHQVDAKVPVVLAKGKDGVAQAMIRRAKECGIPVIRHVWLARTLYATAKSNTAVPRSSYESVAHVYAVIHYLQSANDTGQEVELEAWGDPPESYERRQ
ncbi:MAG: type secretion protein [Burkholderiales bacterium]|jgi:type III secretion protein U